MYTKKRISIFEVISSAWKVELLLLGVVAAVTALYIELLDQYLYTSLAIVTVLGTAISFFIGFINSQAYDRWWEARKIWGELVNDSRSFARMTLTLFDTTGDDVHASQERIVRRHIAYLYAVRDKLRADPTLDHHPYLNEQDTARADCANHPADMLLRIQGEDLDRAERAGVIEPIRLAQLNDMLTRFSTSMGKCERIKTTVFPAFYASLIRISIWVFIVTFPMALSEEVGYWAIPYAAVLGSIFSLTYRAGQGLIDPFEGNPADTAMSTIIRTIEINLLDQLGEPDLPPPLTPIDGKYLM